MTGHSSLRDQSRRQERLDEEWFHLFALDEMVGVLRTEAAYPVNGHTGVTLLKTEHLRIILEAARAGTRLERHTVQGPNFVHVISGSLRMEAGDETRIAHAGELVVIPHDRPREVIAEEESAFLLGLSLETGKALETGKG